MAKSKQTDSVSEPETMRSAKVKPQMVRVGDIVLYAQPRVGRDISSTDHAYIPVIVTRVHNDGVMIDGVAFSTGNGSGFTGARALFDLDKGESEAKWKFQE